MFCVKKVYIFNTYRNNIEFIYLNINSIEI